MFYKLIAVKDEALDSLILKDIERTKLVSTDSKVLKVNKNNDLIR
jgi:hypothetical protein